MVIVFDLDDTLYQEINFVKSGFREVAQYLQDNYQVPAERIFDFMIRKLEDGRGRIFDDLLLECGIHSKKTVRKCLSIYRHHRPKIQLTPEAYDCLHRLRNYPLYIVTDGNKLVQSNKIRALGLGEQVRFCYITHRYGVKNSKPSPYCFLKICEREKVSPQDVIYIGDNPHKDFVGIKPLGFKTIRVRKGQYQDVIKPEEFEADYQIKSLAELDDELLEQIFCITKE